MIKSVSSTGLWFLMEFNFQMTSRRWARFTTQKSW